MVSWQTPRPASPTSLKWVGGNDSRTRVAPPRPHHASGSIQLNPRLGWRAAGAQLAAIWSVVGVTSGASPVSGRMASVESSRAAAAGPEATTGAIRASRDIRAVEAGSALVSAHPALLRLHGGTATGGLPLFAHVWPACAPGRPRGERNFDPTCAVGPRARIGGRRSRRITARRRAGSRCAALGQGSRRPAQCHRQRNSALSVDREVRLSPMPFWTTPSIDRSGWLVIKSLPAPGLSAIPHSKREATRIPQPARPSGSLVVLRAGRTDKRSFTIHVQDR